MFSVFKVFIYSDKYLIELQNSIVYVLEKSLLT